MEPKKREHWIDIAKGIGIVFVMFGHTIIGKSVTSYTYIFNLPTFIFLSGYLFNYKKYLNFKEFFKARSRAILIPYAGLSIISIVFYKFYFNMPIYDTTTIINMVIMFVKATRNQIFYNIPLWFLPTLFFIEMSFYWLRKIKWKFLEISILILLSSWFVIASDTLYNPQLFWTIDTGLFYLLFFAFGYYIRQGIVSIKLKQWTQYILLLIAIIINTMPIYSKTLFDKIFKNSLVINNGLIYYLSLLVIAFFGIYVIISISKLIRKQALLEFLGRNSLTFFGLHVLIFWMLNKVIHVKYFSFYNQVIISIFYVVFTTLVISILIPYLKKYFPNVFGKQEKTSI